MGILGRIFGKRQVVTSGGPGDVIAVNSVMREYAYIKAQQCACGGRWEFEMQAARQGPNPGSIVDEITVRCSKCNQRHVFGFSVDTHSGAYQKEVAAAASKLEEDLDDEG